MLFPDAFYRIEETDRKVNPPEVRWQRVRVPNAAVTLHAVELLKVPADRHAILQTTVCTLSVDAGAATRHVRQIALLLLDAGGGELGYVVNRSVQDTASGTHNVAPDNAAGVANNFGGVLNGTAGFLGYTLPVGGVILPAGTRLVGVTRLNSVPTSHGADWDLSWGTGPLGGLLR